MKIIFALAAVIIVSACNIEGGTTQSVSASPPSAAASAQGATTAAQAAILRRPQKCGASTASGRSQAACPSEQEFEAAFGRCYHIVGFARTKAEAEEIVRQTHDQQSGSGAYRMVDGRYGVSYRMSGPRLVMDRHLFSNAVYGPRPFIGISTAGRTPAPAAAVGLPGLTRPVSRSIRLRAEQTGTLITSPRPGCVKTEPRESRPAARLPHVRAHRSLSTQMRPVFRRIPVFAYSKQTGVPFRSCARKVRMLVSRNASRPATANGLLVVVWRTPSLITGAA